MGVRLHSATKRIVEYSTSAYFNYEIEIINQIIEVLAECQPHPPKGGCLIQMV